ncbi:MAG: ABC transporter ATP-binding protein [Actinomycetota bacterium]|nr:ABC transporter ATP-binding protein [Actinomycetota bacterium]
MRDVVKEYPTSGQVLKGVELIVHEGEFLAIVGPSGSGKTTLLHIMGTLDRATSGQVAIAGRDVAHASERDLAAVRTNELGFVFQQFFLIDGVSAIENVASGLLYNGVTARLRRSRAAAQLDRVGLSHRRDHVPSQLSGGERQRVAVARALVSEPSLLLADEPTGNLDSASGDRLMDLFQELNSCGTTIVLITHDQRLATETPRIVRILDGEIISDQVETR